MKLFLIFILFTLISCSKEDVEEEGTDNSLKITASGFLNLGKVSLGQARLAGIRIQNNTSETQEIKINGLGDPFFYHRIDGDCSLVDIGKGKTCTIIFKFKPTNTETFNQEIGVNDTSFFFAGKGLSPGQIQLSSNIWNAGSFSAGDVIEKAFTFTNMGDSELSNILVNTPSFSVKNHTCGEIIKPQEVCEVVITTQKSLAQDYVEQIQLYSPENPDFSTIDFAGTVTPSDPFGNIGITCDDSRIIANNSDTTSCTSDPITDAFGNIVTDGHLVSLAVFNLYVDGPSVFTTVGGQVSFGVRATDTIAESTVVLNSFGASGSLKIDLTSGPATGVITFKTFNDSIIADGTSSVTIQTNLLTNALGSTVSDGEEVNVIVASGPATISASNILTFNGITQIRVTSTIISGPATITLQSDPIRDGLNNIIGWNGSGSFVVNFIPVPDAGNFDIVSSESEVYYLKNGSGHVDETTITVGPIKNIFDTPIGAGHNADVVITDGAHSITSLTSFTIITDTNSEISFPLKGTGIRGDINITVTVNGLAKSFQVYASGDDSAQYHESASLNKLDLFYTFFDSRFSLTNLPPSSSEWVSWRDDYSYLKDQDNEHFGFLRVSGQWKDVEVTGRHYIWNCMIPVKNYVISSPCADKKISGGDFIYGYYFPYLMKFDNSNAPLTIGGSIGNLPNHSSGFDGDVINPTIQYDRVTNLSFTFGGAKIYKSGPTYYLRDNPEIVTYGQLSLFAYMPFDTGSFTNNLTYPMFHSHSTKGEKVFFYGGLRENSTGVIEAADGLQKLEDADLIDVVIIDGLNGRPTARYQNGVYYDELENRVYIIGGLDINDSLLDDIWYTDLDDGVPEWTRVCSTCGLSDNYTKKIGLIKSYALTGTNDPENLINLDDVRSLEVTYLYSHKKIIMHSYRKNFVEELDITTGATSPLSIPGMSDLAQSDSTLYHSKIDRFYKQKVSVDGVFSSKYYYYDSELGEAPYYLASFDLGSNAKAHALKVQPVVSTWSENTSFFTTEYGAEVYVYDFNSISWYKIGENISSLVGTIDSSSSNITEDLVNPRNYIDPAGRIYILIKPKQEIGYQNNSSPEFGESYLKINHIIIDGIY